MVRRSPTRSCRAGPSRAPGGWGLAVLGAVYPGLLLGTWCGYASFPEDSPGFILTLTVHLAERHRRER